MLFTQTKPCKQCPFRKKSPAGWLGDAKPEEFIDACMDDVPMPCHTTVNYEDPLWRENMLEMDSKAQHCAGARILFANQCKMSKHPYYLYIRSLGKITPVEPSKDVFDSREAFLKHHKGLPR